MSDAILKAVQEHATATAAELKALRDDQSQLKDEITDLALKGTLPEGFGVKAKKSLGSIVSGSDQLTQLRNRAAKSVIVPVNEMTIKTLISGEGDSTNTGFDVQGQRMPGIANAPRRRLSLLDVLPAIQVNSSSFEFVALDGYVNAADYQIEQGDLKAEQDMPNALQTASIATLAVTLAASEQVLADAPGLTQFLDSHLRYGVMSKLEAELITGAGGTGQIDGLLNQATAFTASSGAAAADALGEAIAALESSGWTPGVVVMHPNDWQTIRSERTTDGEYVASGWNQPAGPSVWGVPVVTTAAMTEGNALVMDPAQVALLDRQSVNVATGLTDDQFLRNCITIRAELRAGLACFAPTAVLNVGV